MPDSDLDVDLPEGDSGPHAERSFEARLGRELESLRSHCARRFGDRADDVFQDALARALRFQGTYDVGRPMGPWLRTIASRCAASDAARAGATIGEEPLEEGDTPSSSAGPEVEIQSREEVERLLARLSSGEAEAVRRHHLAGDPLSDIAADEGAAIGTIKARLFRARKRLALVIGTAFGVGAILLWRSDEQGERPLVEGGPAVRIVRASVQLQGAPRPGIQFNAAPAFLPEPVAIVRSRVLSSQPIQAQESE